MPIFESAIQQVTAVPANSATLIWDTDNTSTTTFGPLGAITVGAVLKDVTIINNGPNTMYVGGNSSVTTAIGVPVVAGGQLTLQGYNVTSTASSATGDLYAITASAQTANVVVGLSTTDVIV